MARLCVVLAALGCGTQTDAKSGSGDDEKPSGAQGQAPDDGEQVSNGSDQASSGDGTSAATPPGSAAASGGAANGSAPQASSPSGDPSSSNPGGNAASGGSPSMGNSPGAASPSGSTPSGGAPSGTPTAPTTTSTAEVNKPQLASDGTLTFEFNVKVPVGKELFKCIFGQFPTTGVTAINSAESHYTPGSHHMLAYRTDLTSVPDDQNGVWDCQDGGFFTHQRGSYYEAQQPDEQRTLPDGIAHEFQPGEVVIIQAHYINTTDADIDAHVQFKLHSMNVADVKEVAGTIYFNDTNIDVPPHAMASVTMTCPIPQDINLAFLWSHMHARGTHFVVTTDDPKATAKLGPMLYESDDWSEPKAREYPIGEENEIHAGSHITFSCNYQNDTDNMFRFGDSAATNEMCILHGMYWPRMPANAEQCITGRVTMRDPPATPTTPPAKPPATPPAN